MGIEAIGIATSIGIAVSYFIGYFVGVALMTRHYNNIIDKMKEEAEEERKQTAYEFRNMGER